MDTFISEKQGTSAKKQTNQGREQMDQQLRLKTEECKERETENDKVVQEKCMDALNKECDQVKADIQDKHKSFNKREGTGGISGQLYEIYLVLLILLHGLTNKNIIHFHLASNLKEAGDFDDVVFSYSYRDNKGAEKCKVIFLQAKHKEKAKNISLEELLGNTGKGAFDLKKYFSSFRNIKKNFQDGNPSDSIFGKDFNECEFIIYTNALFKCGHTETVYINELSTEEDWILNFCEESTRYHQLQFSGKKDDRIKKMLSVAEKSEVHEFQEFLSKLKICSAQPNQDQLKKLIKEKIQSYYGVTGSDIDIVFAAVKTKVEEWWKDSCEYLTEQNTFIQDVVRISIRFEVQDPIPMFTGREQTLLDLHDALQYSGQSVISQSASVTGLGGIGKTELARKYVSQYSQYYDNNIIWINAETYATCSESFRRLATDALGITIKNKDGEEKDITSIISEVYAFFAKRGRKSLFIFDNAENPKDDATVKEDGNVKKFLPSGNNKPYVLITSRNQQWGGIKSLQLDLFSEEESAVFITTYLTERQIKFNESDVKSLGEKLQCLPLALRQAVAYIARENEKLKKWNENYTIENYLKEFDGKAKELLGKAPKDVYDTYTKTVLTTWQITIENIRKNEEYGIEASLILNIIAFFSADNIPIATIFESLMDKVIIRRCAEILEQYSMVKLQDGEVSIHRLLQQVIRTILEQEKKVEEIMETALTLFKNDINSNCIVHARSVWDFAKNINKMVENFSYLPDKIITKLVDSIKYNEAYLFAMRTHKLFKAVLGDDCPDGLTVLHWMALILSKLGKYNESLSIYEEVICKKTYILGPDHPNTLMAMHNLSFVLNMQGKYEESLILYQNVLLKQNDILGPDHPDTLATKHNLSFTLELQGNYEESLILIQEVLLKRKEILGPDHPDTLTTIHNLAAILNKQRKYEQSLTLYQEVLCKVNKILGPDHPDTLMTKHNLASVLNEQGKYEESYIHFQEVLCTRKRILGLDHPDTLMTTHNLASVLDKLGKYEESLILYQEALCKNIEILGLHHPDTLITMHNIATVLEMQGKFEESITDLQKVLIKQKQILGPDDPATLITQQNLALVLNKHGKYDESLIHYKEVLNKLMNISGLDHPDTLTIKYHLALVLQKLGKCEELSFIKK